MISIDHYLGAKKILLIPHLDYHIIILQNKNHLNNANLYGRRI